MREFYEQQNERLNDWVEVDALVMAMADDIIDSMNPDADHDGVLGTQSSRVRRYQVPLPNT